MQSATFTLTINQFRPMGGIFPISAQMALTAGDPQVFTINGKNITISVPMGQTTQLTFALPDPNNVLLGIAYAGNTPGPVHVGLQEFPSVTLVRSAGQSQMIVTDAGQNEVRYNYVILVQNVTTGQIGVIDPAMENED